MNRRTFLRYLGLASAAAAIPMPEPKPKITVTTGRSGVITKEQLEDFRIEGADDHILFIDGSPDAVSISGGIPLAFVHLTDGSTKTVILIP